MSVKYHVIAWLNGTWRVRRSGAKRATSVHFKRSEAIDKARKLAKKDLTGGTVVIHGVDGTVKSSTTYGKRSLPSA
jgi:diacylglycerol kinase family enzyme